MLDLVSRDGACVLLLDGSEEACAWQQAVEKEVRPALAVWTDQTQPGAGRRTQARDSQRVHQHSNLRRSMWFRKTSPSD